MSPLPHVHCFRARATAYRRQRGVGLVEVLIAVLVLSIGLLGMAALQTRALQNNQSSLMRSQAVILTYYMLDALRANRTAALAGDYDLAKTCTAPNDVNTLVSHDQNQWFSALKDTLGNLATTCGAIACRTATCTITVYWDDQRATAGATNQTLVTSSRL